MALHSLHFCVRLVIQDNVWKQKKDHPFYTWTTYVWQNEIQGRNMVFFKAHACVET